MSLVPLAVRSTVLVLTFVPRLYRTPEFFKVFEASGCQAATGSAAVGWLIRAWVGSARIFGSAVVEKRSG